MTWFVVYLFRCVKARPRWPATEHPYDGVSQLVCSCLCVLLSPGEHSHAWSQTGGGVWWASGNHPPEKTGHRCENQGDQGNEFSGHHYMLLPKLLVWPQTRIWLEKYVNWLQSCRWVGSVILSYINWFWPEELENKQTDTQPLLSPMKLL